MKTYYYDANDFEIKEGKQVGIAYCVEGSSHDLRNALKQYLEDDEFVPKENCIFDEYFFNKYIDLEEMVVINLNHL